MVSVGVILGIVAVIAVIVLLYMWPEIFGRIPTEYFQDAAVQPTTETLPIDSINPKNLIQAVAVPNIKSLEGFQSGSVHTSLNDGNGHRNAYRGSNTVVGSGYNNQPMDNSPMSGTAAGSGNPEILTTYTSPLANVVMPSGPLAGANAGAGSVMSGTGTPVIGETSVTNPAPILNGPPSDPEPTMNQQVLNSGMINIGDVTTGSYASEDQTSTPSFTVASSQLDQNAVNTLITNLSSGGQYTLNVTSDLSGVTSSFPLQMVTNVTNSENQVYAYTFQNQLIAKPGPEFTGASTLNFQVVQTAPLPPNAPNAEQPSEMSQPTPSPVVSATSFSTASCGTLGYPSADNLLRLYDQKDCDTLTGVWAADGTCTYQDGSFSKNCAFLNTAPPPASTNSSQTPPAAADMWAPTPPNAISSQPPSTMGSIIPTTVSPINAYTFTNQSIMMDASTLAQKIRSAEIAIKCNNF